MLKQGNAGSEMLIRPLLVDWNNGRAGRRSPRAWRDPFDS